MDLMISLAWLRCQWCELIQNDSGSGVENLRELKIAPPSSLGRTIDWTEWIICVLWGFYDLMYTVVNIAMREDLGRMQHSTMEDDSIPLYRYPTGRVRYHAHSIFHSFTSSSSLLTSSSTDQSTRVKNIFIHRHHTWDEWSNTVNDNQIIPVDSHKPRLTQKMRIYCDKDGLPIRE